MTASLCILGAKFIPFECSINKEIKSKLKEIAIVPKKCTFYQRQMLFLNGEMRV